MRARSSPGEPKTSERGACTGSFAAYYHMYTCASDPESNCDTPACLQSDTGHEQLDIGIDGLELQSLSNSCKC